MISGPRKCTTQLRNRLVEPRPGYHHLSSAKTTRVDLIRGYKSVSQQNKRWSVFDPHLRGANGQIFRKHSVQCCPPTARHRSHSWIASAQLSMQFPNRQITDGATSGVK